jgi:hypothetical protein
MTSKTLIIHALKKKSGENPARRGTDHGTSCTAAFGKYAIF